MNKLSKFVILNVTGLLFAHLAMAASPSLSLHGKQMLIINESNHPITLNYKYCEMDGLNCTQEKSATIESGAGSDNNKLTIDLNSETVTFEILGAYAKDRDRIIASFDHQYSVKVYDNDVMLLNDYGTSKVVVQLAS